MLRWFHSYVAKNGMGALEAYDAYAARVRAQRVKAHASVRRRGEAAPAPAKKSGDETNGTKKTPTTTTSAERATMKRRRRESAKRKQIVHRRRSFAHLSKPK